MALTKQKLQKFIKMRNESTFNNNMQFGFDALECGFKIEELGEPHKIEEGHYEWYTPYGKLVEQYGKLSIQPEPVATIPMRFIQHQIKQIEKAKAKAIELSSKPTRYRMNDDDDSGIWEIRDNETGLILDRFSIKDDAKRRLDEWNSYEDGYKRHYKAEVAQRDTELQVWRGLLNIACPGHKFQQVDEYNHKCLVCGLEIDQQADTSAWAEWFQPTCNNCAYLEIEGGDSVPYGSGSARLPEVAGCYHPIMEEWSSESYEAFWKRYGFKPNCPCWEASGVGEKNGKE